MEQATSDESVTSKASEIFKRLYQQGTVSGIAEIPESYIHYGLRGSLSDCCGSRIYNKYGIYLEYGREATEAWMGNINQHRGHYTIKAVADVNEVEARKLLAGAFLWGEPGEEVFVPLENGKSKVVIAYKDV